MKRKLEPVDGSGAALIVFYRVAGTERLAMAITDFGHDYRESYYEIKAVHRAEVLAHSTEEAFANELSRDRTRYGRVVNTARLSRDPATRDLSIED